MTVRLEDLDDPTFDPYLSDEMVFGDVRDPYATIAALRAQSPVAAADYRVVMGIPTVPSDEALPHYTVLSFAGVDQVLNDPTIFVPQAIFDSGVLESAKDVSTNKDRVDIWAEFKSKIGKK